MVLQWRQMQVCDGQGRRAVLQQGTQWILADVFFSVESDAGVAGASGDEWYSDQHSMDFASHMSPTDQF